MMIDASKCSVSFKLIQNDKIKKALVSFKQDETRLSGFILKTGQYGLYLDPPKLPPKYFSLYHDENKERFNKLKEFVIERYKKKIESADMNELAEDDYMQKNLDECWEGNSNINKTL